MARPLLTKAIALVALALTAAPAFGQPPPPPPPPPPDKPADPPPDERSVPRGTGGVIIKPAAQPTDAPKPGQQTMPRPLNYTPPVFPPEAEKAGLEATVTLQLDITKEGKVQTAVVIEPAGHGFDEAAVAAAQKLTFEPARRADGAPFAARILYRYSFTQKKVDAAPQAGTTGAVAATPAENFRGQILLADGDIPLPGATITISGPRGMGAEPPSRTGGLRRTAVATSTGTFTFEALPNGLYKVEVTLVGYDPLNIEESLSAAELTEVKYRLAPKGGKLEVVIRGDRPPREVTKRTLEQREIARIPGTNGDALRSLQNLPGVARSPGVAGLLLVRGSGPADTQTFIDGTPVPLIYHFLGLSSVVPTEILEKIDFYPGNFSAQYGRVMGGIVDVGLRGPKDDGKYHGLAQLDLIDARAMIEGPIPLLKKWRVLAAGRRSYMDVWLGPVLKALAAGVTQAPVYYDYQFMVETNPTPVSKFRVAFFGSDDALQILSDAPPPGEPALAGNIGFHTAFKRIQARYSHDLDDGDKINALFAFGQDNIDISLGQFFLLAKINSLSGRFEYTKKLTKGVLLNAGLDMFGFFYSGRLRIPPPPRPGEPPNGPFSTRPPLETKLSGSGFLPAGYVELEIAPTSRAKIVPGVRLDYSTVNKKWDLSPRVNARYDIRPEYPRTTAKAGIGFYHQPPQGQEAIPPLGNPNITANRAIHYALGLEQDLSRRIEASVEGFYKQLDNQIVPSPSLAGSALTYSNVGSGYAVGSEVLIKYKPDERFFGWLAYTLSRSARVDRPGAEEHLVSWDQTHILTVLGSYELGYGWAFGARFRLVSGNRLTPFVCNSAARSCDPNRVNSLFAAASGVYTAIPFGDYATERMPPFHQLDVRLDKRWKFKSWQLSWYLDIQNIYNNGNVEGIGYNFNYTSRDYVTGLPFLPSVGLRGEF